MRPDIVTISPDYLAPLGLSLVGQAVDDTPCGGGAGMVMKPEPWGEALDALVPSGSDDDPLLVVMTPSGRPFSQAVAGQLAQERHLVMACGRYEGFDARVVEHARS